MSTVIRRLIERFYPRKDAYTVAILGLEGTGKTTLLYLLKTGGIVQTIPSIGFNVEEIVVPTSMGKKARIVGWDYGFGCASIQYMMGLVKIYASQADAVIWMLDSTARTRLSASVDTFDQAVSGVDSMRSEAGKSPKGHPTLILANKQDVPGAMSVDEIRSAFARSLVGRNAFVFPCTLTMGIENSGLDDVFGWLIPAIESSCSVQSISPTDQLTLSSRSSTELAERLESWLARAENDSTPEIFLSQFNAVNFPVWDHYNRLRVTYALLTTYGRQKGKNMIFDGIEKYISQSPQANGRTFHVTMTYFWIQIVHLGIRRSHQPSDPGAQPGAEIVSSSPADFGTFLLLNPYVVDGNLWANYYSKDLMMSPKAKEEMVLPDRKSLPNLIVRDAVTSRA